MIRLQRIVLLAAFLTACGGSSHKNNTCDPVAQSGCAGGQVCETVQNGAPACFAPVVVRGMVSNLVTAADPTAINLNDARVVALDPNQAPLSKVAVTAGTSPNDGAYSLAVPAQRDATGKPVQASFTLRVDRQGYETFPSGVRTALPIDLSSATLDSKSNTWGIASPLLSVKLLKLASTSATAFIHGSLARPPSGAGALIVAEPAPGGAGPQTGFTGVADADGNYAIFNLTPTTQYVVTAYTKGANYTPITTAALAAGDNAVSTLALGNGTGAVLSGGLIYNNGATSPIAVSLVVESTYVPSLDRGDSPPGLTVSGTNTYDFTGVPDGKYVVLAAFGLDGDVRDVSGGGNTAAPQVTILSGAVQGTPPQFKIIPSVDLLTIDGTTVGATPTVITTATPTFAWQKTSVDSSAATYRVEVFDSAGNAIWTYDMAATQSDSVVFDVDGKATAALQPGMTYQLRILAIKEAIGTFTTTFTQLSQTEDVAGVFVY